jgi:tetratricopeptide (TPR) repeat protein
VKRHRLDLLVGLILAVVTFAVYAPACGNEFVNYDDPTYVYENPHVLAGLTGPGALWALTTTAAANWHPLTWLSLQLDASLFGPWPFAFHLTNVLLHAANAVLLFTFLRAATGRLWPSAAAAALFALHPLHVESVAWVAERKDVLSTLFWMLALLAYLWYARRPGVIAYLAVAAALALGLMAKPMLVTLPFVLLLLDYWPLRRPGPPARLVLEKLPLFALAAASCAATLWAQRAGGAVAAVERLGPGARLGNALVAYAVYLRKAVWPDDLAAFYPHPLGRPPLHLLGAALVLGLLTWLCLRSRRQRPYLAVGWLWFLGTLVPVLGLVQVGAQALADRYTYVPLVGLFIAVSWGAADLAAHSPAARRAVAAVGLAALAACAAGTSLQLAYWRDSGTLWERDLAVAGPSPAAHTNLGLYLRSWAREQEALHHFQEAVRLGPGYAFVHFNLTRVLEKRGRLREAEEHYREVVRLDPQFALALLNLAGLEARRGRWQEALGHLDQVLGQEPGNALAHHNCAVILEQQGGAGEALAHYREAVRLAPRWPRAHYSLGTSLGSQGRLDEAIPPLEEAVRLNARYVEARENLGRAYEGRRQSDKALAATARPCG